MAKLQRKIAYGHIIKLSMANRMAAATKTTTVTITAGQGENWVAGCGCRPADWLTGAHAHAIMRPCSSGNAATITYMRAQTFKSASLLHDFSEIKSSKSAQLAVDHVAYTNTRTHTHILKLRLKISIEFWNSLCRRH